MHDAAEVTPALSVATLLGCEVAYETADALCEAGRLWPVTHELARVLSAEYPPPHGLRGKRVIEARTLARPRQRVSELTNSRVQLGAGTAVLSVAVASAYDGVAEVLATDLPAVLPLLRRNVARVPASRNVRAAALPWGAELDAALAAPDLVLCCEIAYWGGWSLLCEDTRAPLRRTLLELGGPNTKVLFACTLRDADRELGLVRALRDEDGWLCRVAPGGAALESAQEGDVLLLVLTRPEHAALRA